MSAKRIMKQQYIGWSFVEASRQTFVDIVLSNSSKNAEKCIERQRPCAVLDMYCKPILLIEYIAYLQKLAQV